MPEEKRYDNLFVTVPAKYAKDKESIEYWDHIDENKKRHNLATVTLPKGTVLPDGTDVSYFKFIVNQGSVDPAGQKYPNVHSILFPKESQDGDTWNVKLTKQDMHKEGDEWIEGEKHEVTCSSVDLQTAAKNQYNQYKEFRDKQNPDKDQAKKPGASLEDESRDAKDASDDMGKNEPVKEGVSR